MSLRGRRPLCLLVAVMIGALLSGHVWSAQQGGPPKPETAKRWLFLWADLSDAEQVDRMIALFPRAERAGYNGVVFSPNLPAEKTDEFSRAAVRHGLALIPTVMGGMVGRDRNLAEGVPVKDALFVVRNGVARLVPDPPIDLPGADLDAAVQDVFQGWDWQDEPGVRTFQDREVKRQGASSVRMELGSRGAEGANYRLSRAIHLQPFRQYAISVWVKTQDAAMQGEAEVKLLIGGDEPRGLTHEPLSLRPTQDWTQYHIVFNSLDHREAQLYMGVWGGTSGRIWWDDLQLEEIGLVNVLRRPGTPVHVRSEAGVEYEEGRDFEPVCDPNLHPWRPYHEMPVIALTPDTRIPDGARLRVSYYHPMTIYGDRVDTCLSEPKVFDLWRDEIRRVDDLYHPPAFFMSHDEIRVANWCAACQARGLSAGQLLADNVRRAAQIIREARPDAEIWVWNDMFDPNHNAVDNYYLVNGTYAGSWEGLDPDIGIANWHGGKRSTMEWFARRGHRQVLCGYYDSDEDGAAIADWFRLGADLPGIVGAMYTTWETKYDAMEAWSQKAWGGNTQQEAVAR